MTYLSELLVTACEKLFNVTVEPMLTRPDEQFGDYATNVALQLASKLEQKPRDIAEQLKDYLEANNDGSIAKVEVAGPGFLNITMTSQALCSSLHAAISKQKDRYGSSDIGNGKTVICEFPSPNMAKPLSVGHIRSALQGWAMYKLMDFMGYKVIRDNHIGDHGTPFGKWVVGFQRYSSDEELAKDGVYELARIYIQITKDLKDEKAADKTDLAEEVQSWLVKLEAKDQEAVEYSQRFMAISKDHMYAMMRRLKIETDEELGESFYVARGQELVDELLSKKVAEVSNDAVIVDLEDEDIKTPIMLRKANGAALYATTDLATLEYRQTEWRPAATFIHTGQEQAFYFNQLKALARKAGYDDTIHHLWHGLVDVVNEEGQREKMSSRKGVILLEALLDAALEKARALMPEGSDADIEAVALGAVKFAEFKADRKTGLLFDWDAMFNVHGFSGPAVQYAVVRIKSIKQKAGTHTDDTTGYDWQPEHQLLAKLLDFPVLLRELHNSYEIHKLAHYLYDLAKEFNRYYEHTRISDAPDPERAARLWLVNVVEQVITTGLDLLGIPVPDKM